MSFGAKPGCVFDGSLKLSNGRGNAAFHILQGDDTAGLGEQWHVRDGKDWQRGHRAEDRGQPVLL